MTRTASSARTNRGQATVEFSVVFLLFMVILLAVLDYAQMYFFRQSLHHALRHAGRLCTTGAIMTTNFYPRSEFPHLSVTSNRYNSPSQGGTAPISRNESIRELFAYQSMIKMSKTNLILESWPGTNNATSASPNLGPGIARDQVRMTVRYPLKLVTPVIAPFFSNGTYMVTAQMTFINEPFYTTNVNRYSNEP